MQRRLAKLFAAGSAFGVVALLFAGLIINILGLPGLWLMVGSVGVYAWLTHVGVYVGWPTLWK